MILVENFSTQIFSKIVSTCSAGSTVCLKNKTKLVSSFWEGKNREKKSKILTFGSNQESASIDPSLSFACEMTKKFQIFRIFVCSPWLSMNLNIVSINKDLTPMIEHILRLEAFGDKFFPADLKFWNEVRLVWNGNFSVMVTWWSLNTTWNVARAQGIKMLKPFCKRLASYFFIPKFSKISIFFIESPLV